MKKTILIVLSLILLFALIGWMLFDLFMGRPELEKNPYDFGMKKLRETQIIPAYSEALPIKPALKKITSVATGPEGKIFVAGDGGVETFDFGGHLLNRISFPGIATCIAVMNNNILVIGMEDHVELWNSSGIQVSSWKAIDTSSVITSVAVNKQFIYVADAGEKIVYKYTLQGKMLARIGEKDPSRNIPGFIIPSPFFDVAISPAGDLWVANTGRYKLEKYGNDGSLLASWGEPSASIEGFAGCCNPSNFTFLPDGLFVTSEKGIERVKIYSQDGKFLALVAGPEAFDEGTHGLDLAATANGWILVIDPSRNQLRIFLPLEKK